MELNLSAINKNEADRLILITIIGLLDSLQKGLLSIEDCERYLFSPFSVKLLEEKDIDEKIIEIIELGCELEDIQSLLPKNLKQEIISMKNQAYKCLKEISRSESSCEVKKWLDK